LAEIPRARHQGRHHKKMKKFFAIALVISLGLLAYAWHRISSSPRQTAVEATVGDSNTSADSSQNANKNQAAGPVQVAAISDADLAKLKSQGLVSPKGDYYIKTATSDGFPMIVSVATGNGFPLKPSANYTKISNLTWSGNGQKLAYLYQTADPVYANMVMLNTAALTDVLNQMFPNAAQVLAAAAKIDYSWLDGSHIIFTELQNYDATKKFYANATLNTYDLDAGQFNCPICNLTNIYSMTMSVPSQKLLYVQAKLDDSGNTIGQQYVISDMTGNVITTSDTFDPNWNK